MPVAKLSPSPIKQNEGHDSLDNFIKQTVRKGPLYSYTGSADSPVQWIQLLHALDQQDHPGWPLLSPLKVQMQKCTKCSQEFCSPINYQRHIRAHRRPLKLEKESGIDRELLGAFWDKLSLDEAKEILSFKDAILEDVSGPSILRALTSFIRKASFSPLPQVCVKAGSALLDIIQSRPSRFPIDANELFHILDDASERTFLTVGTAQSVKKYIFDGEAAKTCLEMKNLIACTSFLVEQKLVQAWVADKDAEALRCQKLLVEEEEAAQRRKAELLERKRQRKLRQKEQRAKDQANAQKADYEDHVAEASSPRVLLDSDSQPLDTNNVTSFHQSISNITDKADTEAQFGFSSGYSDSDICQNIDRRHKRIVARRQVPQGRRGNSKGVNTGQNGQILKVGSVQKHGPPSQKDPKVFPHSNKVWTLKTKAENGGKSLETNARVQNQKKTQPDETNISEVLIGSISISLGNTDRQQEMPIKPETLQCSNTLTPVVKEDDLNMSCYSCLESCVTDECRCEDGNNGPLKFSSDSASAFLEQRWKEAIAGDHVKLDLSHEPLGCMEIQNEDRLPNYHKRSILGSAENHLYIVRPLESSNTVAAKAKCRTKPEKGVKLKYIPKQRTSQ